MNERMNGENAHVSTEMMKGDEYELKLNIFICTSKKCAEYLMPGYEEVFPSHDFQLTFQIRAEDDARNDFW